jgi:hypothetical protein
VARSARRVAGLGEGAGYGPHQQTLPKAQLAPITRQNVLALLLEPSGETIIDDHALGAEPEQGRPIYYSRSGTMSDAECLETPAIHCVVSPATKMACGTMATVRLWPLQISSKMACGLWTCACRRRTPIEAPTQARLSKSPRLARSAKTLALDDSHVTRASGAMACHCGKL